MSRRNINRGISKCKLCFSAEKCSNTVAAFQMIILNSTYFINSLATIGDEKVTNPKERNGRGIYTSVTVVSGLILRASSENKFLKSIVVVPSLICPTKTFDESAF